MFNSVALYPTVLRDVPATKPAPHKGLLAMLQSALESLVEANSRVHASAEPLVYCFPPF